MVDFRGLETFYWVMTLGGFGAAARKLNTTQPAISQRIAALEQTLGTRILTRGSRQVVATPSGRDLMIYTEKLLNLRGELEARFVDPTTMRGVLRLGVSETIVHTWLPDFIKAVNLTYPQLSLEIDVDISPTLRTRLLAQEIDLAFLIGPLTATALRNAPLSVYPLAFVTSPTRDVPKRATLADIARHPIFTFSRRTQPYEALRALFQPSDLPAVNLNASASLSTIVHLTIEGLGIAVIPRAIVARELRDKRLREIKTDIVLPELRFAASWLATPDAGMIENVAELAKSIAVRRH